MANRPLTLSGATSLLAVLLLPLWAPPAAAQAQGSEAAPIPLYPDLGDYTRPITTSSETARAYFNQGLQLMYAFGTGTALRSFRAARDADPRCALCWWGEAWALGPYLNGGMGPEAEQEAHRAIRRAEALLREESATVEPVEAALIEAMAVRYSAEGNPEGRVARDSLYARAMEEVARAFPDDLDARTLAGESLMLLRPRRGEVDLSDPSVVPILPLLEGALERDIRHPGACHLYIHLVEASPEPERAEACADHLGDGIPGASHIQHMPSHIYMTIGRYGDAVRANLRARHADERADHGGVPGVYRAHNLHMLVFAAVLDGQSAVALQAARDLARLSGNLSFYLPVTLAVFGRWDEVLERADRPDDPFLEGMWLWARGMAHLRTGSPGSAEDDLQRLREIEGEIPEDATFRFHPRRTLLLIPRGILEGELAAARGEEDRALRALQEAVEAHDALVYDEPEPWHLPPRLVLGALLLEMDRPARAETIFREALDRHRNLGWALFGLERALRSRGQDAAADRALEAFEESWGRSDIWLRAPRF